MAFSFKKMFSGSGWKKFKGVVGGVLKVGLSVIPGVGGVAGGVAAKLINAKKVGGLVSTIDKAATVGKGLNILKRGLVPSTGMVLKASPVMPGGAIATPYGVAPADPNAWPPGYYGGGMSGGMRPKRRRKRKAKAATPKRRSSTAKRRTTKGRLPKFGSPAWRKRFNLGGKKRRKRSSD